MSVQRADRIVVGRIASLGGASGFAWVEAIAIAGGRVIAAGSASELSDLAGPRTRVWRLGAAQVVLPGITDAHLHLVAAALEATQLDLSNARGLPDALQRVREANESFEDSAARDGWLLGHGWSLDRLGGWPTASDLESVAPGRRIALWAHDHHSRWMSRSALTAAGIRAETPDPPGGSVRRSAAGEPTGVLHEVAATLVDPAIARPTRAFLASAITAYAAQLHAMGVTGAQDPGELQDDPDVDTGPWLYRVMEAEGRLPLRVVASIRDPQIPRASASAIRSGQGSGRYRDGWLKLFADGSLGSRSAALLAPYEPDDPRGAPVGSPSGMPLRTAEALAEASRAAVRIGVAVQIHAIGDLAVRTALAVLAGLERPSGGVQHRIEHAQLVDPADVPRFGELGVAASVQPCHLCTDASGMEAAWGARARNAFPLRSLDAVGALIPLGTDAPVESPDPWRNLAAAVTRQDVTWTAGRGAFFAEEALPLDRAVRAACLDPALSIGALDEGRLVPGNRADFIVVPAEPFLTGAPSAASISAIRPLATALDGDVVFRAAAFEPD